MAIYVFKCGRCGATVEELMPMAAATFEDRACPVPGCGGACSHRLEGPPSLGTEGMTNPSLDVAIGADAERRWKRIRERQAVRDRVRREAGAGALSATTHEGWRAVPGARLRTLEIPGAAMGEPAMPVKTGQ